MRSANLLARFRLGERDAVADVARLARILVGEQGYYVPLDDRDDVVQEILIDVHHAITSPDFRLRQSFDALVRTVAHRRCVDWMRRQRPVVPQEIEPRSMQPGPDDLLLEHERARIGALALRSLGASCRRLLQLRVVRGLTYRSIAERLGRTEMGVRVQMYKCVRRARDLIAGMSAAGRHSTRTESPHDA